jgi:hypothetical protein
MVISLSSKASLAKSCGEDISATIQESSQLSEKLLGRKSP